MDDTYAKLRAKYERMRAEGSCEVFPTARPELVESESLTERAFGRCMCTSCDAETASAGVTACQRCGGSGIVRVVEDFRVRCTLGDDRGDDGGTLAFAALGSRDQLRGM
jgi:hypothetical protein